MVRERHGNRTLSDMADRVSLQQAARRLGVSVRTVQRRIQAGELQAEHVATSRGQRVVVLLDLAPVESEPAVTEGDTESPTLLTEVRAERDWLRGRVEALETTVRGLTIALAQAQHAAQLPPSEGDRRDSTSDNRRADDATLARQAPAGGEITPQPRGDRRQRPAWHAWLRRLLGE